MSVTIRLAKVGKRNAPSYKIVVSNTRDKRNGKYLDVLGHYNPSHNPPLYSVDKEKYDQWKSKGALSSDAVENLIEGTYEFKPYNPKQTNESEENTDSAAAEENLQASEDSDETESAESSEKTSDAKAEGSE